MQKPVATKSLTSKSDSLKGSDETQKPTSLSVPALNTGNNVDSNDDQFPFAALQADSPSTLGGSSGNPTSSFMCIQTTPTAPDDERRLLARSTRNFLKTLKTGTEQSESSETTKAGAKHRKSQLQLEQGRSQQNVLSLLPWAATAGDTAGRTLSMACSSTLFGDDGKLNSPQRAQQQSPLSPRVHFSEHDDWIITSANNNDDVVDEAPPLLSRTAAVLDRYVDKKPLVFCSAMKIPKDPRNNALGYQPLRLHDVKKQLNTSTAGGTAATTTASTGGGGKGNTANRNTRALSTIITGDGIVRSGGVSKVKNTIPKQRKVTEKAAAITEKFLQHDKPKFAIRPPKTREARFDRDAAANNPNNEGFAAPTFPLAHREVEPSGQPSSIGFPEQPDKAAAKKVERSEFQVRLHVPDLTYTKLFNNSRDGRDKVATSTSRSGGGGGGGSGGSREKRFTDKYPFKLPDEYEEFQDGGDSVVEFARRRFRQWFNKQMRTTPPSREATTSAAVGGTKKVHMRIET